MIKQGMPVIISLFATDERHKAAFARIIHRRGAVLLATTFAGAEETLYEVREVSSALEKSLLRYLVRHGSECTNFMLRSHDAP